MFIDGETKPISSMNDLNRLKREIVNDKKFINEYYQNKSSNWSKYPILDYIKKLFFYRFNGLSSSENIISNMFLAISYLIINSSLLKLGYDYFIYSWVLLGTFIIFLIYINLAKYKSCLLGLLIYISSIVFTNNCVYNASVEGIYKDEYTKIIHDDNLSQFGFFNYNIQKLNLFKTDKK